MNETDSVTDRHFIVPLSDVDFYEMKVQAAKADMKQKEWVALAIKEKLDKGGN